MLPSFSFPSSLLEVFRPGAFPRRSASLRGIVDRIRNSLQLDVVVQTAVDEVRELLDLESCLFLWHFPDLGRVQVVCQASCSLTETVVGHYSLSTLGALGSQIQQGDWIKTAQQGHHKTGLRSSLRRLWQHQKPDETMWLFGKPVTLLVPVSGQDDAMGFLVCLSRRHHAWRAADLEFIQAIAQQLEIAIRQAQLYERTQKQAQRERLVNQITTQTRQSLDVSCILPEAIAHLLDALTVDRCLVHLVEPLDRDDDLAPSPSSAEDDDGFRRKHLFESYRSPFLPSIQDFDTNGPITRWVIDHRQQVVISDVTQDLRIGANNPEYQKAQIRSSLVVPVQANGSLYAILYLNQCSRIRYWSRDDQKLAQAVADQLAISIQQAHLYHKMHLQAQQSTAQAKTLTEALDELQRTQAQLIQSEKMSSLGQLVAGVAHEINNPVSFIYGNIPYVERYVADLMTLLERYQQQLQGEVPSIRDLETDIELEFLRQDLPRILQSMKDGAARIREIVASLRNFARLDESSCKVVNVHEGLDSTLAIVRNQINDTIQLQRNYGDLPMVECYPAALNQVFLNLVMNAAEALEESNQPDRVVTVTTEVDQTSRTNGPWVRIRIADNGCGVLPTIQDKIFDPFFTTKEIGKGSGLGLAVSYQIVVHQHRGHLHFTSNPGQGTEFVVELPVSNAKARLRDRHRQRQPNPSSMPRLVS